MEIELTCLECNLQLVEPIKILPGDKNLVSRQILF